VQSFFIPRSRFKEKTWGLKIKIGEMVIATNHKNNFGIVF